MQGVMALYFRLEFCSTYVHVAPHIKSPTLTKRTVLGSGGPISMPDIAPRFGIVGPLLSSNGPFFF